MKQVLPRSIISIVYILFAVIFIGCNKNVDLTEEADKVNNGERNGFVQFTLDNKELEIKESNGILHSVTTKISGKFNNEFLLIGFSNILSTNYSHISISFMDEHPIKEGKYVMTLQNLGYYYALVMAQKSNPDGEMDVYHSVFNDTNPDYRFELTITKLSAKKGDYMEGSFDIKDALVTCSGCAMRSITNGRFRAKLE